MYKSFAHDIKKTMHQQHQLSDTPVDMHVSLISELEDDPYVVTTHTWLMLLLLPEFCTLCYFNDLVKLSCTSRMTLEPAVVEQLSLMDHLVKEWGYWKDLPGNNCVGSASQRQSRPGTQILKPIPHDTTGYGCTTHRCQTSHAQVLT